MVTTTETLSRLRLLQLISPSLPVGAFTYSQGLEWAVECGWVTDEVMLHDWVEGVLRSSMTYVEIPLLARLYRACASDDSVALSYWSDTLLAMRETRSCVTKSITVVGHWPVFCQNWVYLHLMGGSRR